MRSQRSLQEIWHSLWFRLTAAFLLVATAGVIIVAILANRATTLGFRHYLNQGISQRWAGIQAELSAYHEQNGSWEGVEPLLITLGPQPGQGEGSLVLLDKSGQTVALAGGRGNVPEGAADADAVLPIEIGPEQVGTLLVRQPGAGGAGQQFLQQVNQAILWGGLAAVFLALVLSIFLARALTEPLRRLTEATRGVAGGQLGRQVESSEKGELGELSASFNQMSAALAQSEQQRRQMLADVAHELRTPLSISQGHIEAMLDGVFELSPDNLALVHEETLLLGRLVEDLRTLSLAEAGQLTLNYETTDLRDLAARSAAAFEPLAEAEGVQLVSELPAQPLLLSADANRLRQVLGNLLSNALRHVHDGQSAAPQVTLQLAQSETMVQMKVMDNGPGLSAEAQALIFDRFWRADQARSRDQGGSGLGLAICKAIVEAHNGRISVQSTPGRGTTFTIELPI